MLTGLTSEAQIREILEGRKAVIYKHSTRCHISALAHEEVERFHQKCPQLLVLRLDVVENRQLSDQVAGTWAVRHESPQVLIVNGRELLWSGSHFHVTEANLDRHSALLSG
jgi:bacillithiol system protein YtxJ